MLIDSAPPADHRTSVATPDGLGSVNHRLQARAAHAVHVSAGTSTGTPALMAAWRATFMPAPACSTQPRITSSRRRPQPRPERSPRAPPPPRGPRRSVSRSAPPNVPIGVRQALTITASCIAALLLSTSNYCRRGSAAAERATCSLSQREREKAPPCPLPAELAVEEVLAEVEDEGAAMGAGRRGGGGSQVADQAAELGFDEDPASAHAGAAGKGDQRPLVPALACACCLL